MSKVNYRRIEYPKSFVLGLVTANPDLLSHGKNSQILTQAEQAGIKWDQEDRRVLDRLMTAASSVMLPG